MARPLQQDFSAGKQELMNVFPETLRSTGLRMIGMDDELGVISFENGGRETLYAHIREEDENIVHVSVAPGLPELGKRSQEKIPDHTIWQLMQKLQEHVHA